jgi:uroporphyrin-III C-methyltransferase
MTGKVYLVGAGPGDPELLTVKARRLLEEADVMLYDSLTGEGIRDCLPETATSYDVGKKPGPDGERTTQEEIERLMVTHARAGQTVVRLKGGDPTVFGRGGEEAEHLAAENVPFEVVPGVTSAVAAPAVTGIPLTHRAHASSVTVVTGHEAPTKDESALNWDALAETVCTGGTLLVLMGVSTLREYVGALQDRGVPEETPVAMVEKGTWEGETTVTGTLGTIVGLADDAAIEPPAVTVIGDVVAVRDEVSAFLERDSGPRDRQTGQEEPAERLQNGTHSVENRQDDTEWITSHASETEGQVERASLDLAHNHEFS